MAELGRVAQAAIRSTTTSLVRATSIRCQPCRNLAVTGVATPISGKNRMSTTSGLRSPNDPRHSSSISATSPSKTQQQSYASFNWGNPTRVTRPSTDNLAGIDVRKPSRSSYETIFGDRKDGGQTDKEKEGEPPADFASDWLSLDIADIQPKKYQNEAPAAPRVHLRTVPRTGRTVHVKANVDVARSFKLLSIQVAQNRLRNDFQRQRFHERPGLKRKREKSQRWKRNFRKGFLATVARVRELTSQGW
ncbi:hypothetical protein F5B18DRAFT_598222 [Nemania serpens]|nr:hypothetical protein F5B18DRAFT_598222 [Nemania serpens]